jgi:hypothetical protein
VSLLISSESATTPSSQTNRRDIGQLTRKPEAKANRDSLKAVTPLVFEKAIVMLCRPEDVHPREGEGAKPSL